MSWQSTAYVNDLHVAPNGERITRSELLLLFVLSNRHNMDHHMAWPSLKLLAFDARMSQRQCQYLLQSLERKGVLLIMVPLRAGGTAPRSCIEKEKQAATILSGPGYTLSYVFLELDPDPRLQHTLEHQDCPACADEQSKAVRFARRRGNKGAAIAPLRGEEGATATAPLSFPQGCKIEHLRVQNRPAKGAKSAHAIRKEQENYKSNNKPSASTTAEAADPRHAPIREMICKFHAEANGMPLNLVPWGGREGAVLARLLKDAKALTFEHAQRCALNYYRSDVNISRRPATWIAKMREYWCDETNQYDTPRSRTKEEQERLRMSAAASLGTYVRPQ